MPLISRKRYTELESQLNNLVNPEKLDSKDKKYLASIEKSLTNFDSSVEWADYISSLTRLSKALQSHSKPHWIPHAIQISKCLAKCVSSTLPSGVHKKSLEVYEHIFNILQLDLLAKQMNLWIPGLLPLMSYASISVKPSLIDLFDKFVLELPKEYLKVITKVLLLSLLPGIDDESSESFDAAMALIEKLQKNLQDDTHFWQCFFMTVISSPDRRLGALVWCNKHLPNFSDLSDKSFNYEAEAVVKQETGLLIRAFCKGLEDDQILVQRGFFDLLISKLKLNSPVLVEKSTKEDVERLVMSCCLTVLRRDMSLNRRLWNWLLGTDESLSTPLIEIQENTNETANDDNLSSTNRQMSRIKYFTTYGQNALTTGFLNLINSTHLDDRIRGYKLSLAFMDRWEIGLLLTSEIFVPFLKSVQASFVESNEFAKSYGQFNSSEVEETDQFDETQKVKDKYDELFKSASAFFDTIESRNIWSTCFQLIDDTKDVKTLNENLKLILFIIRSFNVNEEDMLFEHLPCMLIALLVTKLNNYKTGIDAKATFDIIEEILSILPTDVFASEYSDDDIEHLDAIFGSTLKENEANIQKYSGSIYKKVQKYYSTGATDAEITGATLDNEKNDVSSTNSSNNSNEEINSALNSNFELEQLKVQESSAAISPKKKTLAIFILITEILIKSLQLPEENNYFYAYSSLYTEFMEKLPAENNSLLTWKNFRLLNIIFSKGDELLKAEQEQDINVFSQDFSRELILDFYSFGSTSDGIQKAKAEEFDGLKNGASINEQFVSITFGISKLFPKICASYNVAHEKINLLKLTLELLYRILLLSSNKYQVEATSFLFNLELASEPEYIESGISLVFSKLHNQNEFEKIMKVVKILWTQTNSNPADVIMRKPLYILLDELNYKNSNYLVISDWLKNIFQTESYDRLFSLVVYPLLNFKFIFQQKFDLIDDFDNFNYQLRTIINIIQVDEAKVVDALNSEVTQIDENLLAILQSLENVSTYKSLLMHILFNFLSLTVTSRSIDSIGWEIFESEAFNKATLSALHLLSLILDASEPNINQMLAKLIDLSYNNLKLSSEKKLTADSTAEQLIHIEYLKLISKLIYQAHHKNKNLSIFKINLESPIRPEHVIHSSNKSIIKLNYIEYLIFSLGYIRNMLVFKYWVKLLVDNLLNLSDCIFQVLIPLTETICSKIMTFFDLIRVQLGEKQNSTVYRNALANVDNVDQAIGFLMNALEELLNYSHMYLSASEVKPKTASKSIANDPGFLTSVMSGVFSVESPENISFEESNRFTVLLSFESTAKTCFDLWLWGEEKTIMTKFTPSGSKKSDVFSIYSSGKRSISELDSSKSTEYIASKVKFKSRRLLEKLYQAEPLQVLHTLMINDLKFSSSLFRVLHILDNSRPQLTIPHIFDSIHIRLNPESLKNNHKSSLNNKFSEKKLGIFLVEYLKSLDATMIEDIYGEVINFLKDINTAPSQYRAALPYILRFVSILTDKLSKVKFGEQRKVRKEIGDYYLKILSFTLSSRGVLSSKLHLPPALENSAAGESENIGAMELPSGEQSSPIKNEEAIINEKSMESPVTDNDNTVTQEDLCLSLASIIPELNNSLLQEGEKATSIITLILLNVVHPIFKVKKIFELPSYVVQLLLLISESSSSSGNKIWRNLISEIYNDTNFFSNKIVDSVHVESWRRIVISWLNDDKDKVGELVSKIQYSSNNSSALFNWSEGETNSKVLKLKRVTYLLLISPKDKYLNLLNDLIEKLIENLTPLKDEINYQVFLCLRALILQFSETHLNQYWLSIYTQLEKSFQNFLIDAMEYEEQIAKRHSESSSLTDGGELRSVFSAAKLLDLLLTLGFEEFNLDEWLFIDDSLDSVAGNKKLGISSNGGQQIIYGLIDKISQLKSYKVPRSNDERRVKVDNATKGREKVPILYGYSQIDDILLLKPFFDLLSYYSFERLYGLKKANIAACKEDVFNDLFQGN